MHSSINVQSGRTNRFQSFTPLRRLRTAFSPQRHHRMSSSSSRSLSPSSSIDTISPLTRTSSPDSHRSVSGSSTHSIRELLILRRKPSMLDVEIEEERRSFGNSVVGVLEPRPEMGGPVGIFEVLDGKF